MTGEIFHVGERALLLPIPRGYVNVITPLPFGEVVTVISPLRHDDPEMRAGTYYRIETAAGNCYRVTPRYLRKLPPSDPAYLKFRDQLVREISATSPARHPAIASMLDLIGQGERA